MSDASNPQDWVDKADEDYEIAKLLLRRKRLYTYGITFHAQQCAEKYLKGLLVKQGVTPPKIHDLVTLNDLCLQAGIIMPIDEDNLSLLTNYAAQTRYPGDDPTPDEAKYAFEVAKAVRKFAKRLL
jgi:HEPN domain-containing protein